MNSEYLMQNLFTEQEKRDGANLSIETILKRIEKICNIEIKNKVNEFAYNWIAELECEKVITEQAYAEHNKDWEHTIKFEIQKARWEGQYRKVSELCHTIGGDVLKEFENSFPFGIDTYIMKYFRY